MVKLFLTNSIKKKSFHVVKNYDKFTIKNVFNIGTNSH